MNHALPSFTCPVVQTRAENAEGERKRGRTGPDTAPGGALGLSLSLSPKSSKFQAWKLSAAPDHFSPFPRGTENPEALRLIERQRLPFEYTGLGVQRHIEQEMYSHCNSPTVTANGRAEEREDRDLTRGSRV